MLLSKKGAAILQVLLLAAVLAGIATMILRFAVARTASARQNRRVVAAQLAMESCMAEVNEIWMSKSPEAFERDMNECIFKCNSEAGKNHWKQRCRAAETPSVEDHQHTCRAFVYEGESHTVTAVMRGSDGKCSIEYSIDNAKNL